MLSEKITGKIYLILCLVVSLDFSVSAQQVKVSGADYSGINGTYTQTSFGSNFSYYENDKNPSYYFKGSSDDGRDGGGHRGFPNGNIIDHDTFKSYSFTIL